jgi:tetratricopeptide (TPR) repeat protein
VGVFSKESAVVLPGLIAGYEMVWGKRRSALLWGCAATMVPIAAMLWQRSVVLGASAPAEFPFVDNPIAGAGFWTGRLTAIKVLARYLWLTIWPLRLSADYSYSEIPLARGSLQDWIAWIAIAAALALTVLLWRRNRTACFFAGFAFLNLLPTANLIFPVGTIMAERFLYLPAAGLLACLILAVDGVTPRANLAIGLLGLVGVGFGVRTWMRNRDWRDDLTMATASVQSSPRSFKVHRLLATALFQSDSDRSNLDRVLAEGDQSIAILEGLADELNVAEPWNLAAAWHLAKGDALRQGGARAQYERAVQVALRSVAIETAVRASYDRRHGMTARVPPTAATGYRVLASAYLRLGEADKALPAAMQARTINPASTEVYAELANAYLAQKRGEEAAMALAEGMFATSDQGLRNDLVALYRSGLDIKGCAVVAGPRGPALNPGCEMVHRDLCAGAQRAHRMEYFRQLSCPAETP